MINHFEPSHVVQEWMDDAECVGYNPNWWFTDGLAHKKAETQMAMEICNECPVTAQCLNYAMSQRLSDGIFGGLRAHQRNELHKKHLRKANHGQGQGSNDG